MAFGVLFLQSAILSLYCSVLGLVVIEEGWKSQNLIEFIAGFLVVVWGFVGLGCAVRVGQDHEKQEKVGD